MLINTLLLIKFHKIKLFPKTITVLFLQFMEMTKVANFAILKPPLPLKINSVSLTVLWDTKIPMEFVSFVQKTNSMKHI